MLTVPNFTSSLLMLFFVQPLFRKLCYKLPSVVTFTFVQIHTDFKILSSLMNGVKVGTFG